MFTVTFGGGLEPVTISDDSGQHLAKLLESGEMPPYVVLRGRTLRSSLIRSVEPQVVEARFAQKSAESQISRDLSEKEWRDDWKKRHDLPPPERAKRRTLVDFVWWATTGSREIPEPVLEAIRARCEQYFIEHPEFSYANPACYMDLVKGHFNEGVRPRIEKDGVQRIDKTLRLGAMDFVGRVLQRDQSFSRRVHQYGFDNVRL